MINVEFIECEEIEIHALPEEVRTVEGYDVTEIEFEFIALTPAE